jgi:hypothetical protein
MKREGRRLSRRRIRITAKHWTAIPTKCFEDVLPMMRRRQAATVYLALYHRVWHTKGKRVGASLTDLAKWTGLDSRTVAKCVRFLEWRRFIMREEKGTLHSHSDLPIWKVPATRFDMKSEGWVPVPSFLITHYLKAHSACLLLPLLLYHQNFHKRNDCYPSVMRLAFMTGCWSKRMVYESLRLMGDPDKWDQLGAGLPVPVEIIRRRVVQLRKWIRHYRVRAVYYHRESKRDLPALYLTKEFSKSFGIRGKSAPTPVR